METVVPPPGDIELHLLTEWGDAAGGPLRRRSAVLSLVAHAAAIVFLLAMPETFMQPPRPKLMEPLITPLIAPPLMLTQKEPNTGKQIRQIRSADLTPRASHPSGPSPDPTPAAPRKASAPPPPKAAPPTPLPEPPKLEIATVENPKLTLPVPAPQVPQPKARPAFEDVEGPVAPVPPGQRVIELPGPSVASAIRGSMKGPGINLPGTAQIPSTGAELPQLLSDPQGVDFRPYLAQVLASVKRYWFSILPKSGRRGEVSVQFAIQRDGTVRTVAFVQQTGDASLDNAVIASISGGGPFGPLPARYRGGEIHVQMNFAYNVPQR